jgi:hypothetical protein
MNKIGGKITRTASSNEIKKHLNEIIMATEIKSTTENSTTSEHTTKPMYNNAKNSKLRFLDLLFTGYFAFTFICFVLNFFGISHYYEGYFTTTWFVFALFIQLLATRLITIDEILFTKFPYEFHSTLRIVLFIQLLIQHGVFYILVKSPDLAAHIQSGKIQFLICNALLILWSFTAIYKNFTKPKTKKDKKKK